MAYAFRKPKKKKNSVDQSELKDHKFFLEKSGNEPEFRSEKEQQEYQYEQAKKKFTPEDEAAIGEMYDNMNKQGQLTGDPVKDMEDVRKAYIVKKGGAQASDLTEYDNEVSDGPKFPLRGATKEEVRAGRRINKQTTVGSGYDYDRGRPAAGSITRRRR